MQGMERQAYKYRCHPAADQVRELARTCGGVRCVDGGAPVPRTAAWIERQERIDHAETDQRMLRMKQEPEKPWLAEASCVTPLQQVWRHFNAAFVNFFASRAKYPRFHRQHDRQSATYRVAGCRWNDGQFTRAKLVEPLDMRGTRPVGAEPTSVSVSMDPAGRYCHSSSTEQDAYAAQRARDAGLMVPAGGQAVSACRGDLRPTRKRVDGPRRSGKPR